MMRAKGIVTVLVLSFGLGTGANAAVYGALDALLMRAPEGVEEASRLVDIYTSEFSGTAFGQSSYPDYLSLKSNATSFAAIAAVDTAVENVRLDQSERSARIAAVTEDFFPALQMRAHAGRLLVSADALLDPAPAVVSFSLSEDLGGAVTVLGKTVTIGDRPYSIVDELLARRYFGPTATGRHLRGTDGRLVEIVGVVRSGRYRTLQQPPQPAVYYPATQEYLWRGHAVVRTAGDPALLLDAIDRTAKVVGEGGTVLRTSTLETHLSDSLALDRLTTTLVGMCGLIALAISTIGVYGVMTDAVRRRTREIGVRLALGAGRAQVAHLVFMEAAYLSASGLLIGTVAALAITGAARSFVYGTASLDVVTMASASGALAIVMSVGAILPLRRALRVNPTIALRAE